MKESSPLLIAALALAAAVGGFFWWQHQQKPDPAAPAPAAVPAVAREVAPPPAPPDAAVAPPIQHPVPRQGGRLPPLAEADSYVNKALVDLLGKKGVLSFLAVDNFVRRFVATVDNLANEQAPARLWPVNPAPGKFLVDARPDGSVASPANAKRYAALVRFVDRVDTQRAVALYLRLYPLFQEAYEELGYPDRYFNDRLIQVIDHLLATPTAASPIRVKLVQVEGATRPLYQFADPWLESRSAGQKILMRIGRDNAATLRAKLEEIRGQLLENRLVRKGRRQ